MKISVIDLKKLGLAALCYAIISQVINSIVAQFTMSYYTNPAYFGVWSKLMMPTEGPPPAAFFVAGLVFDLVIGAIFWVFYLWVKGLLGKQDIWQRAANFAAVLFVITMVPSVLSMTLVFNLPFMLLLIWAISALIVYYLMALVFVKLAK